MAAGSYRKVPWFWLGTFALSQANRAAANILYAQTKIGIVRFAYPESSKKFSSLCRMITEPLWLHMKSCLNMIDINVPNIERD